MNTHSKNPTADELLDFIERECLMVNVEDSSGEPKATVYHYSHHPKFEASSLRAALIQAYRAINAIPEEQPEQLSIT